jgi:hypothetical protein
VIRVDSLSSCDRPRDLPVKLGERFRATREPPAVDARQRHRQAEIMDELSRGACFDEAAAKSSA